MKSQFIFVTLASLAGLAAGCSGVSGAAGDEERTERAEDALKAPAWLRGIDAPDFGCGVAQAGEFAGRDTAHSYTFAAKAGRKVTFDFRGTFADKLGAAVAVYEGKTGRRVAVDVKNTGSDAHVSFVAPVDGDYTVGVYTVKTVGAGKYDLRAVCEVPGMNDLPAGQSAFESLEMPQRFWRGGPLAAEAARADKVAGAPAGRTGPVEEADVYKIDGTKLFYLNTYRGFLAMDMANPKAPKVLSRLPLYGYPVEMFVQNNTVYALLRDALYLTQTAEGPKFERHHVSQLVSIDITDILNPKVLQTVDIVGELQEGVSRKIGDTLYVVSSQPQGYAWGWGRQAATEQPKEQAWAYSFNVANPKKLQKVQELKIFEGGGYQNYSDGTSSSRWFQGVTISATSNALMVVENWNTYSSVYGAGYSCGTSESLNQAVVSVIDISDPQGAIRKHTSFETYGQLGDQFKQTYVVDPATGKGTYYGIFARREWSSAGCTGESHIENALEAWDVTDGSSPSRVGKLAFGKPNETVRGSVFDTDRGVAFAITAENRDPLYALDLHDPTKLSVLSAIDGLSGDMNVFRFIGGKRFLVAIGQDNSDACTGFDGPATGWSSKVATSIIDVQDLTKIRLVQRQCVAVQDASWISSDVNWDLDQAHKMIGLHEDALANVITVPVYYWKKTADGSDWNYQSETAVGMMGWDLTKYDPTKDEKQQNVLQNYGTVVHPEGQVKRSIVFTHNAPGAVSRRKLLNLSNTNVALNDIENLSAPTRDAALEIAPNVGKVFAFGTHVVEQIDPSWESYNGESTTEFRVKSAAQVGKDNALTVASFKVARAERVVRWNDNLVVFRRQTAPVYVPGQPYVTPPLEAVVYSLATPAAPQKVGSVILPVEYVGYGTASEGYDFQYDSGSELLVTGRGVTLLAYSYDQATNVSSRKLVLLDLAGAVPSVESKLLATSDTKSVLGLVGDAQNDDAFYVTSREEAGTVTFENTSFQKVLHTAQRFVRRGGQWNAGASVSLPGRLFRTTEVGGQRVLLAHDNAFELTKDGAFRASVRVNSATVAFGDATVEDSASFFGKDLRQALVRGGALYLTMGDSAGGFGGGGIMPLMTDRMWWPRTAPASQLAIFKISTAANLLPKFQSDLGAEGMELVAARGDKLFLQIPSDGLLVLDVDPMTAPKGHAFLRTLGYGGEVEISGNKALVAAGHYGVYSLPLSGAPSIVTR